MNHVYYVGSGNLSFELVDQLIKDHTKLELAPEAELRIQ